MSRPSIRQPPHALIQLHYHNRVGGVTTVIGHYARAFARISGADASRNLIVCHPAGRPSSLPGDARVISVPDFDYRDFRSVAAFERTRTALLRRLTRLIEDPRLPRPLAVVGHNLTLGKNCALSSAFARCARAWQGRDDDVRFFSVIHDFAEEGRLHLLRRIDALEAAGAELWTDLYAASPNLRFVVLSPRDRRALARAGIRALVLPNPVDLDRCFDRLPAQDRRTVIAALHRVAADDCVTLNDGAPWFFYPARVIARKNVLEAVVVACLVLRGNLLLGVEGDSPEDRALCRRIRRFCARHSLPVLLDAPRIRGRLAGRLAGENPFELLYRFADACVTTSVTEGFGYALYEPWLYGTILTGRLPMELGHHAKVDLSGLYRGFDVPASWVRLGALAGAYRRSLSGIGGAGAAKRVPRLDKKGSIDFGTLDQGSQFAVAERLVAGEHLPASFIRTWARQCRGIASSLRRGELIARNRRVIRREYGCNAFDRRFVSLLASRAKMRRAGSHPAAVRRYFARIERMRLLMTQGD